MIDMGRVKFHEVPGFVIPSVEFGVLAPRMEGCDPRWPPDNPQLLQAYAAACG